MPASVLTSERGRVGRSRRLTGGKASRLGGAAGGAAGFVLLGALLAGCGGTAAGSPPTWEPAQTPSPIALPGQVPGDGDSGGIDTGPGTSSPSQSEQPSASSGKPSPSPSNSPPTPSTPTPSTTSAPADPNVVATRLAGPTGLAVLPDGTALVAERATGRILQVQPRPGKPVKLIRTLTGLDASGGGGVLDLALSATYSQDGLVLAMITTKTDVRVVHFTLTGVVTPVLIGIPRAKTDNSGRLLVRPDGTIYIATSDAGDPASAVDAKSLAGKVLHVDDVGQALPGNPMPGSRVLTSGHQRVQGLCGAAAGAVYEIEANATDEVNYLVSGGRYGAGGSPAIVRPSVTKGITDCAVIGRTLFVTGLGGRDIFSAPLYSPTKVGPFTSQLHGKYGRLRTVVAASDGTLWITTSNRDGSGTPVPSDDRVLHIRPSGGGGSNPA